LTELFHSPLFGQIREYFERHDTGERTLFLFVPYIRTEVVSELLAGLRSRAVIVTTWEPSDLVSGSSDLSLYPFCRERKMALYVSKNMHLKVYSAGLESAVLATGNVSRNGLCGGNYEAAALIEDLTNVDRLFFERIRRDARLVDDAMYEALRRWSEDNKADLPEPVALSDIVPDAGRDDFLISALPMTRNVDELVAGYTRIGEGLTPSDDPELSACIFHDLANYGIEPGLPRDGFVEALSEAFFAHPFIRKIDGFISPEAYFGRIKEWIQGNCTDVPVPSRRELTGNVQVLLEWFEKLGDGKYIIDVPGARSQRIRKI